MLGESAVVQPYLYEPEYTEEELLEREEQQQREAEDAASAAALPEGNIFQDP